MGTPRLLSRTDPSVSVPGARQPSLAAPRLTARQHALVLAASCVLTALFTYPLIKDPGHLLPVHKDPLMYAWTMVSNVHRLLSAPLQVFHGNTFYPNGNSVAYTDFLLTPTLFPAGPVYLLTGNPVLQYNVTLLVWWALSAWAMYLLAFALLRSHAGAALAAVAFAFCPFRTDFFLEFQMQLAFPIPLALLCLWRSRRWPRCTTRSFSVCAWPPATRAWARRGAGRGDTGARRSPCRGRRQLGLSRRAWG
ncbi:MAG: hypothetical protein DMD79_24700 [Candidatus Rokuibacteriota bacterium]|nr:MAG: hypothetical protein DMD79_24700 [Candidatus Rokubacteria bacterium]